MSDIKLDIVITGERETMFKRCIRKLLESTFIVKEKDEKLYTFIARESNRQEISDYLQAIGFDVLVDTNVGIAMLRQNEEDEDLAGLKRANAIRFSANQTHILIILWSIYLEKVGYSQESMISKGDLIDRIKEYKSDLGRTELNETLRLFKRYSLIDYDMKDTSEDSPITLYPSLQFGWGISQLKTVADELMKSDNAYREEDSEEEEDI